MPAAAAVGAARSDRLVYFERRARRIWSRRVTREIHHWRSQTAVVSDVSAFTVSSVNYTGGSFPEQLQAGRVSRISSSSLAPGSKKAARSRLTVPPNGEKAVAQPRRRVTRFNSDPEVVGKTMSLDGAP
jgi:hypothetical protein